MRIAKWCTHVALRALERIARVLLPGSGPLRLALRLRTCTRIALFFYIGADQAMTTRTTSNTAACQAAADVNGAL